MDESGQGRRLQSGDIVKLKLDLTAYVGFNHCIDIPAGIAAVVQSDENPDGLVFFVCPELRDKRRHFLPASYLEFVRSRQG